MIAITIYEVLTTDVVQRLEMITTGVEAYFSLRMVNKERIELCISLGQVGLDDALQCGLVV
jgi:hypothetical protein